MTKEEYTKRIKTARECLTLISRVAARGTRSEDPGAIGYALAEISQVLFERSGSEERLFEPIPVDQLHNLDQLFDELGFVDSFSSSIGSSSDPVRRAVRGTDTRGGS